MSQPPARAMTSARAGGFGIWAASNRPQAQGRTDEEAARRLGGEIVRDGGSARPRRGPGEAGDVAAGDADVGEATVVKAGEVLVDVRFEALGHEVPGDSVKQVHGWLRSPASPARTG
jgi:hypothetical protein